MTTRVATIEDQDNIVELLKQSLGETSSEKSARYWQWKHLDNPFGLSPVWVAEADGHLVGVRAFMRWQWQKGDTVYAALRAVDTATHPSCQGRGIFKTLTLGLAEACKKAGDDFIFNTPNAQSRPGYLKMGWERVGQLPVRVQLCRPFQIGWRKLSKQPYSPATIGLEEWPVSSALDAFDAAGDISRLHRPSGLHTPISLPYLRWRYADCPVQTYSAIYRGGSLVIFYVRDRPIGRELRIVQLLSVQNSQGFSTLSQSFRQLKQCYRPDFISVAPSADPRLSTWLSWQGFLPQLSIGPILTYRSLRVENPPYQRIGDWDYQLGDLELF